MLRSLDKHKIFGLLSLPEEGKKITKEAKNMKESEMLENLKKELTNMRANHSKAHILNKYIEAEESIEILINHVKREEPPWD